MRKTYDHALGQTHYLEKTPKNAGDYVLQVVFPVWIVKDTVKILAVITNDFDQDPLLKYYRNRYALKGINFKQYATHTSVFIYFNK